METFPCRSLTVKSIVTAYYKSSNLVPKVFMHSYRRFCVFSRIFEFFSRRQVSNISKLSSEDGQMHHFHTGLSLPLTQRHLYATLWTGLGGKKRVWRGRRRLQYQAELSAYWSTKCQIIHIHLFGQPQQRGSALGEVQTEMADISAFKRLTAAHKQHAHTQTLSDTPTHTHSYCS